MSTWSDQGFFKETDAQLCTFKKALGKDDDWLLEESISSFVYL